MTAGHYCQETRSPTRRLQSGIIGLALCCLLTCVTSAAAFDARRPVRSLQEIRHEGVVIQKWDVSCGAAALATVLTYGLEEPVSENAKSPTGMLRTTGPLL